MASTSTALRVKRLTLIMIITLAFAVASSTVLSKKSCSPWKGVCNAYEDCCRHLVCSTYTATCIPDEGVIIPGEDNRPIGDGPFPPGYPYQ